MPEHLPAVSQDMFLGHVLCPSHAAAASIGKYQHLILLPSHER